MEINKDQLLGMVKIHECPKSQISYIRLIEIPNPYRSQFAADSYGSTNPLIENEGPCSYSWDWLKWVDIRFRYTEYKPRFPEQYHYISDDECTPTYFHKQFEVRNISENSSFNIIMKEDYVHIKFKDSYVVLNNNSVTHSILTFERMMELDKLLDIALENLKEAKYRIIKCGLPHESIE
jgi:hypothetical protein